MEIKPPTEVERAIALLELAPVSAAGRWDALIKDTKPQIRQLLADGKIGPSFEAFVEYSGEKAFWVKVRPAEQSLTIGWANGSFPSPYGVSLRITDGSNTHEIPWEPNKPAHRTAA